MLASVVPCLPVAKRELARWVTEGRVQPQSVRLKSPAAAEG